MSLEGKQQLRPRQTEFEERVPLPEADYNTASLSALKCLSYFFKVFPILRNIYRVEYFVNLKKKVVKYISKKNIISNQINKSRNSAAYK